MPKVTFYGGPYDGIECDLPFIPELLIGETMDGDWGSKNPDGTTNFDFRVSTYIYQLTHPNGENEPLQYRYRRDRPEGLSDWLGI